MLGDTAPDTQSPADFLSCMDGRMAEMTDLHRQTKLPFDINIIWWGFKIIFLPVHINTGLAFAPQTLPTSCSFKSEDEIKMKESILRYDGVKITFI